MKLSPIFGVDLVSHELVLESRRFAREFAVSDRILVKHMSPDFMRDIEHAERLNFSTQLLCQSSVHVVELPSFKVPDGWWQAFKSSKFPAWLLKRYPVRMKTLGGGTRKVDVAAMFPEIEPLSEKHRVCYWSNSSAYGRDS